MQRMTRKKPESLQGATPTTVQERHKRKVSAAAAQQQKQKATNEKKNTNVGHKKTKAVSYEKAIATYNAAHSVCWCGVRDVFAVYLHGHDRRLCYSENVIELAIKRQTMGMAMRNLRLTKKYQQKSKQKKTWILYTYRNLIDSHTNWIE